MTDPARFLLGAVAYILFVVLPVFWYLKRRRESDWRIVLSILGIWVVWNMVHAPIHELSHMAGGWLVGQHVKDCQLIQRFWEGSFVRAYVAWKGGTPAQYRISTAAPYFVDAVLILLGVVLSGCHRWRSSFAGALVLLLMLLRPLYDIATNYAADTVFGGAGDVGFLLHMYPPLAVHGIGWGLMLLASAGAIVEIRNSKALPVH